MWGSPGRVIVDVFWHLLGAFLGYLFFSITFVKKKNNARNQLLKSLNPILQKYMDENGIMMIMNEKNVILANSKVDLTNTIIDLLNKELKSIKLN